MSMNYVDQMIYDKAISVLEQNQLHNAVEMFAELPEMRTALSFYAKNGAECRLIHSGGNSGRTALADDGGKLALSALGVDPKETST
tara:strand:- start:504 stop:761 length:258 start_codon:yes stop_codon:yes gene_type:complete